MARIWLLRIFAADTISIAAVTFWVLPMERWRRLISLVEFPAIVFLLGVPVLPITLSL